MNERLRRTAAILLVVTAALFVIGVNAEPDTHPTETPAAEAGHDESAETSETGHADTAEAANPEASHRESNSEGKVLGVDIESPASVALAVIVSLALAVGLWLRRLQWLSIMAAAVAVVFAVFDVAEVVHQLDESRTGLAALAGMIAVGHAAVVLAAGGAARIEGEPS